METPFQPMVGQSPFGQDDQRGALHRITAESRQAVMARIDGDRVYDLSVDYFIGMPSVQTAGDPPFQIFMTHTPRGNVVDNIHGAGREINECVGYSGDVILMYTHTGTHVDAFNHFGYHGQIYNGFAADEHLGSRHWRRGGADQIVPIVARGVMLDVAAHQEVECLPNSYGITIDDCRAAIGRQGTPIGEGDVAVIRTGRMRYWPDGSRVMGKYPGVTLETARWLTASGIIAVGADQGTVERMPSTDPGNWAPGHCHFLAEAGVPMFELLNLEELSRDQVYEFAFIAAPIRLRGATGAPVRPLAFPFRQ